MRRVCLLQLLLPLLLDLATAEDCGLKDAARKSDDGETTFVMIKPDGVQRGLVGEVVARLERKGLQVVAMKLVWPGRVLVEEHYREHLGRPFLPGLVQYVTSGPVMAMAWKGTGAIGAVRSLLGATDPLKAAPGTIRGDLGLEMGRNLVHASDGEAAAAREVGLWFREEEVVDWSPALGGWVHQ